MKKYSYVIRTDRGIVRELVSYADFYNIGDEVWVDGEHAVILSKNF